MIFSVLYNSIHAHIMMRKNMARWNCAIYCAFASHTSECNEKCGNIISPTRQEFIAIAVRCRFLFFHPNSFKATKYMLSNAWCASSVFFQARMSSPDLSKCVKKIAFLWEILVTLTKVTRVSHKWSIFRLSHLINSNKQEKKMHNIPRKRKLLWTFSAALHEKWASIPRSAKSFSMSWALLVALILKCSL